MDRHGKSEVTAHPDMRPHAEVLDIEFRYTLWDRIRSGLVMSFQTVMGTIWSLAFPLAGLALLGILLHHETRIGFARGGLILICLFFSPMLITFASIKAHFFGTHKDMPFHYRFGDFGLCASSELAELRQPWKAILKVKRQGGFLLLFFTPACAHCLPYRQLSALGAAERVVAIARANGVATQGV